jgi:uncharacterized protein DUF6152
MIGKKGGHMRKTIVVAVAAVSVLAAAGRVLAHHAFSAEFDAKKSLNLRGVVKKVEWINPHTWIHIDVKKADGTVETWMIEGGTPNTLLRRGITKNSLVPGTEIVVDGFQALDGSTRANGRDVTFPDGRKLFLGSSGTGAPKDGRDPTER